MNAPVKIATGWMTLRKPHRLAPCCKEAIDDARALDALHRAQRMAPPADIELERNALGLALIGDKAVPSWLEPKHFYGAGHARIFEAIQTVGGHLVKVARHLRTLETPPATSLQLAQLVDEAVFAAECGWHFDWPRLVELAHQRALLLCIERVAIRVRAGELDHTGAIGELREHVRSCK